MKEFFSRFLISHDSRVGPLWEHFIWLYPFINIILYFFKLGPLGYLVSILPTLLIAWYSQQIDKEINAPLMDGASQRVPTSSYIMAGLIGGLILMTILSFV